MALVVGGSIAQAMEGEIVRRFDRRGSTRDITEADRRRLATVAGEIEAIAPGHAAVVMKAFVDHAYPVGSRSFRPIKSLYFEWQEWSAEVYPTVEHLFPVTASDEAVVGRFFADWRALREDRNHYRSVYRRPSAIGGAKLEPAYLHTPDFLRVLSVLRDYQREDEMSRYPLFTMRGYLAAQVEALSGFLTTMKIGNVVSEKARGRFDEWYLYRFYNLELVKKGLKRPSDNNPVSNPAVRVEYEGQREGSRVGDFTFEGEDPVPWMTTPARQFAVAADRDVEHAAGAVKLPPGMGDLLR